MVNRFLRAGKWTEQGREVKQVEELKTSHILPAGASQLTKWLRSCVLGISRYGQGSRWELEQTLDHSPVDTPWEPPIPLGQNAQATDTHPGQKSVLQKFGTGHLGKDKTSNEYYSSSQLDMWELPQLNNWSGFYLQPNIKREGKNISDSEDLEDLSYMPPPSPPWEVP